MSLCLMPRLVTILIFSMMSYTRTRFLTQLFCPAGGLLMIAGAPVGDSPVHSPAPDSFESVASAPSHVASTQLFIHDSDPDQASSAAPMPSFVFEHDDIEDSDPVFPPGFDPDRDIEFVHMDQPVEDPVDPADPFDPIDPDFDFDMAF
ncbi:hypothetical protein HanPSC8_Chr07g0291791 [Helianthus annuus]|nr:hypothetical protein HanPSC8_Chr07g0291791 [Helianthus annuus]